MEKKVNVRFAISLAMIFIACGIAGLALPHLGAPRWLIWAVSLVAAWAILAKRHPVQRNSDAG
jgi:bacteriorhodopsin